MHGSTGFNENSSRQAVYTERNGQARSRNHCCSVKVTCITQSECVFVALGIQHAVRMHDILASGLAGSTVFFHIISCRSQWPRGLRRRSTTVRLLGSWVRIPPGAWTFVYCECCVLSGRDLCDELAPRPGKSYRLWYVVVCKFEIS